MGLQKPLIFTKKIEKIKFHDIMLLKKIDIC